MNGSTLLPARPGVELLGINSKVGQRDVDSTPPGGTLSTLARHYALRRGGGLCVACARALPCLHHHIHCKAMRFGSRVWVCIDRAYPAGRIELGCAHTPVARTALRQFGSLDDLGRGCLPAGVGLHGVPLERSRCFAASSLAPTPRPLRSRPTGERRTGSCSFSWNHGAEDRIRDSVLPRVAEPIVRAHLELCLPHLAQALWSALRRSVPLSCLPLPAW